MNDSKTCKIIRYLTPFICLLCALTCSAYSAITWQHVPKAITIIVGYMAVVQLVGSIMLFKLFIEEVKLSSSSRA